MHVILLGNYAPDQQYSMQGFLRMMSEGLRQQAVAHTIVSPRVCLGGKGPGSFRGKWLGYMDKYILFPISLRRVLRTHSTGTLLHILDHSNAVYAKHAHRMPSLVTVHDCMAIRSGLGEVPQNPLKYTGRAQQRWIRNSVASAPHLASVSQYTASEVLRLTHRQVDAVIPLGFNARFEPMELHRAKPIVAKLGAPLDKPYILHVGNNSWYKNRDGVLSVFAHYLKSHGSDVNCVFAGKPLSAAQKEQVNHKGLSESVFECPRPDHDSLQALYAAAALLLFPSWEEGFGWPPLEAQACGCPVVASIIPTLQENLRDTALLAPAEDNAALAQHMASILQNPELAQQLSAKGLVNVQRFRNEAMIQGYLDLYQSILSNNKAT